MTISVQDFARALKRRGVGSPQGDALRAQADQIEQVSPGAGAGLYMQADEVDAAAGAVPSFGALPSSGGTSAAQDIASLVTAFAPLISTGVSTGLALSGKAPPRPAPKPPSAPWSTGAKVGVALAGAAGAGGLLYALWPKKKRRR